MKIIIEAGDRICFNSRKKKIWGTVKEKINHLGAGQQFGFIVKQGNGRNRGISLCDIDIKETVKSEATYGGVL